MLVPSPPPSLGLVLLGADPLRPAKRINPGARYRAMEGFFKASHSGVAGAAMMTSTASVQVNLDAGPAAGRAGLGSWLAHSLGPTLVAIAANFAMAGRLPSSGWLVLRQPGVESTRPSRCGADPS